MAQTFIKDKDAVLDFAVDWSDWLGADTISTSTWDADDGITIEASPAPSVASGVATVWLSGGTVGQSYRVTNHIVTAAGREDDRSIRLRVTER